MPTYVKCCEDCGDMTATLCVDCNECPSCCECPPEGTFDADELGIDPEVDAERYENA